MQRRRGCRLVSSRDETIGEPAWHHSARRNRAAARLLLQAVSQASTGKLLAPSVVAGLRSAASALDQHHGSAVPQVVASWFSMPDDVIFGPRFPTWACTACSRSTNWASRVVCSCGKRCLEKIRAAATRNAYESEACAGGKGAGTGGAFAPSRQPKEGKALGGNKKAGELPTWSEIHTLSEKIKMLEQERRSERSPKGGGEPASADRELEDESAEAIRLQISELEGTFKTTSNEQIRKIAKEHIEELKGKLQDRKTPEDKQSAALWRLKKSEAKENQSF